MTFFAKAMKALTFHVLDRAADQTTGTAIYEDHEVLAVFRVRTSHESPGDVLGWMAHELRAACEKHHCGDATVTSSRVIKSDDTGWFGGQVVSMRVTFVYRRLNTDSAADAMFDIASELLKELNRPTVYKGLFHDVQATSNGTLYRQLA